MVTTVRTSPWRARSAATALVGLVGVAPGQAVLPTVFVSHYFEPSPGGTIATFTVGPDGTPSLVGNAPSGTWAGAMAVSPSGAYLAAATAAGSSDGDSARDLFFIHRVNADSTLDEVLRIWVPNTASSVAWMSEDVLVIAQTDSATISRIWTYRFDAAAPALTPIDFEVSGIFTYTYAADAARGVVWVEDSGFPAAVSRFLISPDGTIGFDGEVIVDRYPLGLTVSPDGGFLYAASGISDGRNKLTALRVNPIGSPTPATELPGSPFVTRGNSPARLTLARDGAVLVVGHGTDSLVQTFLVAPDGSLTDSGFGFDAGGQGELGGVFASIGDLVFFTDDSSFPSAATGLYTFRVGPGGELTRIGDLVDTGNRRPGEVGLAVWPGLPACRPDLDGDGTLGVFDILLYFDAFGAGDASVDLNGDGRLDVIDILAFFDLFAAGC